MGLLDGLFGGGLQHDFNYKTKDVNYDPSQAYQDSVDQLNRSSSQFGSSANQFGGLMNDYAGMSKNLYDQGMDRIGPDSQFVTDSQNQFREDLDASTSTQMRNIGQMLAQQGVGGGIRGIMESGNQTGDTLRKSRLGFQEQGFQQGNALLGQGANYGGVGANFGGLKNQALTGQMNARNSIAGHQGQMDSNMLNVAMQNTNAYNQKNQYANNMNYENKAYNQNRSDAMMNSLLSGTLGAAGTAGAAALGPGGMFANALLKKGGD